MPAPTSDRPLWDRAATPLALPGARRRAELASLPPGLPDLATLFTFARDAELRFATLRLRIEDRTWTAAGERLEVSDVLIRHPGQARVTTTLSGAADRTAGPGVGPGGHQVWLGDGRTVRTYSTISRVATERPARRRVVGLDQADLPGRSRVYEPLTGLPMESLPEVFVHPANYCQNVLATGACVIAGQTRIAGREAILVECDHPRTIEIAADRPDHRLQVAIDTASGLLVRLVETLAGQTTRLAEATVVEPGAVLPDGAFALSVPPDSNRIY